VAEMTQKLRVLEIDFDVLMKRKPYLTCTPLIVQLASLDARKLELLRICNRAKPDVEVMKKKMDDNFKIAGGDIDAKRKVCTDIVNRKLDDFMNPKVDVPEHAMVCIHDECQKDLHAACKRGFPGKNATPTGAVYRITGNVPGQYAAMCEYRGTLGDLKKAKDANQWAINTASTIMPEGDYCRKCTNCQSSGFVLTCNCTNDTVNWFPSALNFQNCFKKVSTSSGNLVCG
jgi:hypothetical protein